MKRILAMAHSYYMLLVLIHLKHTIYKNEQVDVIITDDSRGSEQIYEKLRETGIFQECYYLKSSDLTGGKEAKEVEKLVKVVKSMIFPRLLLKDAKATFIDEKYNLFLSYVSCRFEEQVIFSVLKKNNPDVKCVLYEEGIVSYYAPRGIFSYQDKTNSNLRYIDILKKVGKNRELIENNIEGAWIFNPELIQYTADFAIYKIPSLDENKQNVQCINAIFDYNVEECSIPESIVFLEDNAVVDGHDSDDVNFVEKLVEVYGKDAIAVKLHPRSKKNRFENCGVKIYTKAFPLELFMMNEKKSKVFVTMNSGAPLSCLVDFNIANKVIYLYKCSKYPSAVVTNQYFERHLENIKKFYGEERLIIPNSMNEFMRIIKG